MPCVSTWPTLTLWPAWALFITLFLGAAGWERGDNDAGLGGYVILTYSWLCCLLYIWWKLHYARDEFFEAAESLLEHEHGNAQPDRELAGLATQPDSASQPGPSATTKKKRLYWLDNLKVALTMIVVLHHTTGSFAGLPQRNFIALKSCPDGGNSFTQFAFTFTSLNQTYFMPLFFFISGLFTPTSLDRKGTRAFLSDKFKRLLLPFIAYTWCFGPTLDVVTQGGLLKQPFNQWGLNVGPYWFDNGPTWFLLWLVTFNVMYAMMKRVPGGNVKCGRPSLWVLLPIGAMVGMSQYGMSQICPSILLLPNEFGGAVLDVVGFTAGVVAKRNSWVEVSSMEVLPAAEIICARLCTIIFAVIVSPGFGRFSTAFDLNGGHCDPSNTSFACPPGQWSTHRFAFLFLPGHYAASVPVGFYTEVAGLGRSPDDVVFTGERGVYHEEGGYNFTVGALDDFWRSASNFRTQATANWMGNRGMLWAVSQASPLRRVRVDHDCE
eukprot:g6222.t1